MEDVFKFLLVIGVIVVGLIKHLKKEAKEQANNRPDVSIPDMGNPLPQNWENNTVAPTNSPKRKSPKVEPFIPANRSEDFERRVHTPIKDSDSVAECVTQDPNEAAEFTIYSTEKARQAIIWSEILQRKY